MTPKGGDKIASHWGKVKGIGVCHINQCLALHAHDNELMSMFSLILIGFPLCRVHSRDFERCPRYDEDC